MSTKTKEEVEIMVKVFWALFINTIWITILVNADFTGFWLTKTTKISDYIFNAEFDDFNRDWYIKVGSTIVITLMISIVSPHLINALILHPIQILKRRFCWKRYKTQYEINQAFLGPEFDISTKVSQLLNVVFSCFVLSGGMPLLNIVCLLACVCIYWADKFMILRYYRKPAQLSNEINDKVI